MKAPESSCLKWDGDVVTFLALKGYDPAFGARPLKRVLQQEVETPLSRRIIADQAAKKSTLTLRRGEGGVEFA